MPGNSDSHTFSGEVGNGGRGRARVLGPVGWDRTGGCSKLETESVTQSTGHK